MIKSADPDNNMYMIEIPGITKDRSLVSIPAQCITKDALEAGTEVNIVDINNQSPEKALGFDGSIRLLPNTGNFTYTTDKTWKSFDEIYRDSPNSAVYGFLYSSIRNQRWQKECPLYTFGIVTEIVDKDTLKVAAQMPHMKKYQWPTLTCRTDYMTCNTAAFSVGDIAVVKFEESDINKPVCVGFWKDPQDCLKPFLLNITRLSDSAVLTGDDDKGLLLSIYNGDDTLQTEREFSIEWDAGRLLWVVNILDPDPLDSEYWIKATCDHGIETIFSLKSNDDGRIDGVFDITDKVSPGTYDVNIYGPFLKLRLTRGDGANVTPDLNPVFSFEVFPSGNILTVISKTYDTNTNVWTLFFSTEGLPPGNILGFIDYTCDDGISTQRPYRYKPINKRQQADATPLYPNYGLIHTDVIPYWVVIDHEYETEQDMPWLCFVDDALATDQEKYDGVSSRIEVEGDFYCNWYPYPVSNPPRPAGDIPLGYTWKNYESVGSSEFPHVMRIGAWGSNYTGDGTSFLDMSLVTVKSSIPYRTTLNTTSIAGARVYPGQWWPDPPPPIEIVRCNYSVNGSVQPGSEFSIFDNRTGPFTHAQINELPAVTEFYNAPDISGKKFVAHYRMVVSGVNWIYFSARTLKSLDPEWNY